MIRTFIASLLGASIALTVGLQPTPQQLPLENRVFAQEAPKAPETKKAEYPRGYKLNKEVSDKLHAEAARKHGNKVANLPKVLAPTWDFRALGVVPPIRNQSSCGSCYDFSACGTCSCSLIKAGTLGPDGKPVKADGSFHLSEQYGLDCQNFGGCGGGDESEVADYICKNGFPSAADYGPYTARSNRCQFKNTPLYGKGGSLIYATPGQQWGPSSYQDIKNLMVSAGVPLSCALDANGLSGQRGAINLCSGRSIDHAVMLIGWDDNKGKNGALLMRNSWGTEWADDGYCWLDANSYIVEVFAVTYPPVNPPAPTPYKLFIGATQVGQADGYTDLKVAQTAAQDIATAQQKAVDVKDNTGKVVATIQPVPPGPGPGPVQTPGSLLIDWDAKTVNAGKNWTISGGKLADSVIDLAGLDPKVADAIRTIYNAEKNKPKADKKFPNCDCKECNCYGTCKCKDGKCECEGCQPRDKMPKEAPACCGREPAILINDWNNLRKDWGWPWVEDD